MQRTLDAERINLVVNHPEVHKWLGVEGTVDLTNIVQNPDNYLLEIEGGGFLALKVNDGIYEIHSTFLPEVRGKLAKLVQECLEYMFFQTDCHTLLTQLPDNNLPAQALASRVGFKPLFRREETTRGPTTFARYTIEEWVHSNSELEKEGEWFHSELERLKEACHSIIPQHGHDTAHDRAVGAAVQMLKAGNSFKGLKFYNDWAKFAGYAPINLISENPIVIDIVDAVLEVKKDGMEMLLCR